MKGKCVGRCLAFFIGAMILILEFYTPMVTYASENAIGRKKWNNLKTISTSEGSYYKIEDLETYGFNMSTGTGAHGVEWHYDADGSGDGISAPAWPTFVNKTTRVSYEKKFQVERGMTLNLVGAKEDKGSGGANTTSTSRIVWNVMEWTSDGWCIYDSGWMLSTESWTIGNTRSGGELVSPSISRDKVAYITLIFRYASLTGDLSIGAASAEITPKQIEDDFANLYLCYQPFVYTIQKDSVTSTVKRVGVTGIKPLPTLSKNGYTGYWLVTNTLNCNDNWMNGNTYSTEQLNAWMSDANFYNSLFGNVTFSAVWDKYPEISVSNRYFTLEEARGGKITQTELLKKVKGVDLEDGTLVNGRDVTVEGYTASTFLNISKDAEVLVTYKAKDSCGNTVVKSAVITIVDTAMKESGKKRYVRFISKEFFVDDEGGLISAEQGGVESTSIWRMNETYRRLLEETLKKDRRN